MHVWKMLSIWHIIICISFAQNIKTNLSHAILWKDIGIMIKIIIYTLQYYDSNGLFTVNKYPQSVNLGQVIQII